MWFIDLVMWATQTVEGKVNREMVHDELLMCGV